MAATILDKSLESFSSDVLDQSLVSVLRALFWTASDGMELSRLPFVSSAVGLSGVMEEMSTLTSSAILSPLEGASTTLPSRPYLRRRPRSAPWKVQHTWYEKKQSL